MSHSDIAGSAFWDGFWGEKALDYSPGYKPPAVEYWGRWLPSGEGERTCLEIGCYPGRNLVFLHKEFGFRPIGVDYTVLMNRVAELFREQAVPEYRLFNCDLMELPLDVTADIVVSVGFVEHFLNWNEVIARHVVHASPGGLIVIVVPNFRYLQYHMHNLFDREILRRHVLSAMDPAALSRALEACGVRTLGATYWETFDWWCETEPPSVLQKRLKRKLAWLARKVKRCLSWCGWDRIPNRWLSPWIVVVGRRQDVGSQDVGRA